MGKSDISEAHTTFEHTLSNLRRALADGTSESKPFHLLLRGINRHSSGDVSAPNVAERIRAFEVEVGITLSVCCIRRRIFLNEI